MKKVLIGFIGLAILGYLGLYVYLYSTQDDKFKSIPLAKNHNFHFDFDDEFEEINLQTKENGLINSLLFKADSSVGIVCFWKGNGGTLDNWGNLAQMFVELNQDVIITDYRQHGKSEGEITMNNFYSDCQAVYDFLKTRYSEDKITIIGYSLGTTLASHLSTFNNPNQTILIDPKKRFSVDVFDKVFPLFPTINIFPFSTEQDIRNDKTPVTIITGTKSVLYKEANELRSSLKNTDKYLEIQGATHASILNEEGLKELIAELLKGESR
ncbi:MAG: alpha/beta fold hydrolase [Bacteroidota bacterium]